MKFSFILRREKEKVLKLPPINETIIYIGIYIMENINFN